MRFLVYALLLIMLITCLQFKTDTNNKVTDRINFSVRARLIRSFDSTYVNRINFTRKTFKIDLVLKNESKQRVAFWIMYCSWQENFLINYPSVHYLIECTKNFPIKKTLNVNDSIIFHAMLWPNEELLNGFQGIGSNPLIKTTRFGFLYIDTIECKDYRDFNSFILDRSKQENVYWSNPLYLFDTNWPGRPFN